MNLFLVRKNTAWYVGKTLFDATTMAIDQWLKGSSVFYLTDAFELQFLTAVTSNKINPQQAVPVTLSHIIPLADVFAVMTPDCIAKLENDSQIAKLYIATLKKET